MLDASGHSAPSNAQGQVFTSGERRLAGVPYRGPSGLQMVLGSSGASATTLVDLAHACRWLESRERAEAVSFAGTRVTPAERRRKLPRDPGAAWPWIDSLDIIELEARGVARGEIAEGLGYTNRVTVGNRAAAMVASADAERERADVFARRASA